MEPLSSVQSESVLVHFPEGAQEPLPEPLSLALDDDDDHEGDVEDEEDYSPYY